MEPSMTSCRRRADTRHVRKLAEEEDLPVLSPESNPPLYFFFFFLIFESLEDMPDGPGKAEGR